MYYGDLTNINVRLFTNIKVPTICADFNENPKLNFSAI